MILFFCISRYTPFMRYFILIFLSCLFVTPVSAQTKTKKKNRVIDLFKGEKSAGASVVIETGEQVDFDAVSGQAGFQLKFQRGGNGIFVPAVVNGKKVYFLFDTGATTTTLNAKIARRAGAFPEGDAPVAILSTANGNIKAKYGVIKNLKLGGRSHFKVSYALCVACPSGKFKGKPIAGLLGMNVIGRYRASIDDEKGVVDLVPLKSAANRVRDIRLFLEVQPVGGSQGRHAIKIKVLVRNRGKIPVKNIKIKLHCQDQKVGKKTISKINGRSKKNITISVPSARCGMPRVELTHAKWGY